MLATFVTNSPGTPGPNCTTNRARFHFTRFEVVKLGTRSTIVRHLSHNWPATFLLACTTTHRAVSPVSPVSNGTIHCAIDQNTTVNLMRGWACFATMSRRCGNSFANLRASTTSNAAVTPFTVCVQGTIDWARRAIALLRLAGYRTMFTTMLGLRKYAPPSVLYTTATCYGAAGPLCEVADLAIARATLTAVNFH